MVFDVIIRNARVVSGEGEESTDIAVLRGKIAAIGDLAHGRAAEIIDARGLILLPGGIDTQVHFREPGLEHKEDLESGTRAAIFGGITSILEMPNTNPTTTDAAALDHKLKLAAGRAWANYGFFVGATTENAEDLRALESLPGTPGIKIFMGSSTGPLLVGGDDDLRRVLKNGRKRCPIHAEDETRNAARKSLISAHPTAAEHPFLRDAESAIIATRRILKLSRETDRGVHILHISTADEPWMIDEAYQNGVDVTCEITPQHLYFSAPECYERLGSLAQMNPPIRSEEHRLGLWKALDAHIFEVFGSDHAPHTLEEKSRPYPQSPSGMPGVQTLLPVLLTFVAERRIPLTTVVRMLCENPARLYGIVGKGRILPGYDADFALVDLSKSYRFERNRVQSKCGWSPYEGETFTGEVNSVWVGGQACLRDGELLGLPNGSMLTFLPSP